MTIAMAQLCLCVLNFGTDAMPTSAMRTPTVSRTRPSLKDKAKDEKQQQQQQTPTYQPPLLIPSKEEWVKDETVALCVVCQTERFSMVRFEQ